MDRVAIYYITVTRDLLKLHKFVTLVPDVILVNNVAFLITRYHGIKFVTVSHVPTCIAELFQTPLHTWLLVPKLPNGRSVWTWF